MDYNNILALTDTEFFQKLTERKNENIHIAYKQFVVEVNNLCHKAKSKMVAINALVHIEVEISQLQTQAQRDALNEELTDVIVKSLSYVRQTLSHIKDIEFTSVPGEKMLEGVGLTWDANATDLVEMAYAFKVSNIFGDKIGVEAIFNRLAKAFNVKAPLNYCYNKYLTMKVRSRKRRTYFLDGISDRLNEHMNRQDREEKEKDDCA